MPLKDIEWLVPYSAESLKFLKSKLPAASNEEKTRRISLTNNTTSKSSANSFWSDWLPSKAHSNETPAHVDISDFYKPNVLLIRNRIYYDYFFARAKQYTSKYGVKFEFKGRIEKINTSNESRRSDESQMNNNDASASDWNQLDSDSESSSSTKNSSTECSFGSDRHSSSEHSKQHASNRTRRQFYYLIQLHGDDLIEVNQFKNYLLRLMHVSTYRIYDFSGCYKQRLIEEKVKSVMKSLKSSIQLDTLRLNDKFSLFILSSLNSDIPLIDDIWDDFKPVYREVSTDSETFGRIKKLQSRIESEGKVSVYLDYERERIIMFSLKQDVDTIDMMVSFFRVCSSEQK